MDYYWANVDHDVYFNAARLHQYHEVIGYVYKHVSPGRINVLDAGCGPGYFLQQFGRVFKGLQLTGVDYSIRAVQKTRYITGQKAYVADLVVLPITSRPFDLVFCLQTLEHIDLWPIALNNLMSVVKSGGHLIVTIPNGEFDRLPQHVNRWTFSEFHEILKPYGDVTMRYLGQYSRILGHVRKGNDDKR